MKNSTTLLTGKCLENSTTVSFKKKIFKEKNYTDLTAIALIFLKYRFTRKPPTNFFKKKVFQKKSRRSNCRCIMFLLNTNLPENQRLSF